jgi:uncharacterized protein (TIGR00255 family)
MTGFARSEGYGNGLSWAWEIKSVNGKSLDVRFRLAPGFEALELPLRTTISERLKRGSITVNLTVARTGAGGGLRVNREALAQVSALAAELVELHGAAQPRADGLLALRGILETGEEDDTDSGLRERRMSSFIVGANEALDALLAARVEEGRRMARAIAMRLREITALVGEAEHVAAIQPEAMRTRLLSQVSELLAATPAIAEERIAQEVALLVVKGDLREELDRLSAHVAAASELLAADGAVGRRLDFLCQEFNREANTLCSKSSDLALTRIGLGLKAAVEQLREQVQNIE